MKKFLFSLFITVTLLIGLVVYQYFHLNDGKLHVVFCDVGQGDAIFIRTPNGKNILIDGGPNRKILDCLAKYIPFWERNIALMILTHPHADHFMGMYYVIERYDVESFATERLINKSDSFMELMKLLRNQKVPVRYVTRGDRWVVAGSNNGHDVIVSIFSPTEELLYRTSPGGAIGESREFASLIANVSYESFDLLLTGDSQVGGIADAVEAIDRQIEVLQSPHHGSRTGLNQAILEKIAPRLAVISVGLNGYGHPSPQILDLFQAEKVPVLRTDKQGDVEIETNGKDFNVKNL